MSEGAQNREKMSPLMNDLMRVETEDKDKIATHLTAVNISFLTYNFIDNAQERIERNPINLI